jgi:DNA-directed RNA polymerase specialized sigma24 family protein
VMAELEGFSIAEIAESQRSTATAVKTRISRAKKRLRERYATATRAAHRLPSPERS